MIANQTSLSRRLHNGAALRPSAFPPLCNRRRCLKVANAITRQRKEETVTILKEKLDKSAIVFGMRFKGLNVATVEKFRKGLPGAASVVVCKNTLMRIAAKDFKMFEQLSDASNTKGENAWVFVPEDVIQDTVKHYFTFSEDLFIAAKRSAPKNAQVKPPTELSAIVMNNSLLDTDKLRACEKLPTKKELIATIAGMVKQPPTRIAASIKQVPTKLAMAIKLVSELDEDKGKTVASFAKA